jgi:hypothetical protein
MRSARSISNNLESSQHLTDREETKDLGEYDADTGQLLRIHVPELAEDIAGLESA